MKAACVGQTPDVTSYRSVCTGTPGLYGCTLWVSDELAGLEGAVRGTMQKKAEGAIKVSETRRAVLANGLNVITREVHHVPIASFWVWYRVGSRNEVPGLTGISHWVEHMMFKGTPSLCLLYT